MTGLCRGNGIALGLTDGTDNFGVKTTATNHYVSGLKNKYGSDIGINAGSTTDLTNQITIGITNEADKSGIIVERNSSKYLNFYIN